MKVWPSKRLTAKLAASNAVVVRAALKASADIPAIARGYIESHPTISEDVTADRQSARTWARINIVLNNKAMNAALRKVYSEGWVTGDKAARSSIKTAALQKAPTIADILRDPNADVWAGWTPGNEAAAALLSPPGGLQALLDKRGITIGELDRTSYDRIGTILADGLRTGQATGKTADALQTYLEAALDEDFIDPSRALTIALTETSRAVNQASLDRYAESMISEVEWFGIDPCEICAENDGEVVALGDTFPSGDDAPPAHPNCYCTLLPVIPSADIEMAAIPQI